MYRLHKWVGVSALVVSVAHWLTVHAAAWASVLGGPPGTGHGPRAVATNPIEQWLRGIRGEAEIAGAWAFYGVVMLVVVSLATRIPYRLFYKSHRLLAVCYLALVVHTVVLTKFTYWRSPVALILLPLLGWGAWASVIVLGRRVGRSRQMGCSGRWPPRGRGGMVEPHRAFPRSPSETGRTTPGDQRHGQHRV
jgi:predicted ferric reductase